MRLFEVATVATLTFEIVVTVSWPGGERTHPPREALGSFTSLEDCQKQTDTIVNEWNQDPKRMEGFSAKARCRQKQ